MVAEVYQRKDYWLLMLCIPATFGIGVSCGLPRYLFLRPRSIF
jgi:nitrate/nitrite transporter NarK